MLRAAMIDGFGWFEEADFRRSWLFFDDVRYILPPKGYAQILYPQSVFELPQYQVVCPELDESLAEVIVAEAIADAVSPEFQRIAEGIPSSAHRYAGAVAASDPRLRERLPAPIPSGLSLAMLSRKLLHLAAAEGMVPVVGRRYAWELIRFQMGRSAELDLAANAAPLSPSRSATFQALSAGLSLHFIPDRELAELPFSALSRFKAKNSHLLEQHQLQLVEAAQAYNALPEGPEFGEHLCKLRLAAEKQRVALDAEAREAWISLCVDLGRKVLLESGAVMGALALCGTQPGLLHAALVAGGVAAATATENFNKFRKARGSNMAYLFAAKEKLAAPE
jgi:hypothetical protein